MSVPLLSRKGLLIGLALFAAISLITVLELISQTAVWQTERPASCLPDTCFCELVSSPPLRQPANTLSSLSYVLIGALVLGGLATRAQAPQQPVSVTNPITDDPLLVLLFALALLVIGIGSAYFHASLTFTGQFFDVFGMYLFTVFMLVYAWLRLFNLKISTALLLYVGINAVLAMLLILIPDTRRSLFALVLIVALFFEIVLQRSRRLQLQTRWFYGGLFLFAVAYVIWLLDNSKTLCNPASLLQGHAIWHILGALATGILYIYYTSERKTRIEL